jgi:hypothetical protein
MAFTRKLANKLDDLAKKNEEVHNFLESIPEWADFYNTVIQVINAVEAKPLGSDPRKKEISTSGDDYFDIMYRLKETSSGKGGSGFQNKCKSASSEDKDNNDDEDEEEEDDDDQVKQKE